MQLADFLKIERGRMRRVAVAVAVAPAYMSQIANRVRPCPAELGAEIENACDMHVRRWDLRPDDWHRIWPELIGAQGAPGVPVVAAAEASDGA